MDNQPIQSPPPIPSPNHSSKTFLLILGAIALMAVSAVGGYYLGANKQSQTPNWKTYTNSQYGFEIKYPLDWQVEAINNDSFIKLSNIKIDKQYRDAAKKIATEGTAFNNGLFINIYESDKTLEDFIQSIYNNPDSPHGNTIKSIKNIGFPNGMQAIFVESNTGGYGLDSATLLKSKNYVFRFTKYSGGGFGLEKYPENIFDQILSTFRFLN